MRTNIDVFTRPQLLSQPIPVTLLTVITIQSSNPNLRRDHNLAIAVLFIAEER